MYGIVQRYACRNSIPPVAAVHRITRVAKTRHQFDPHLRDSFRVEPSFARLGGEAETRHRWDHDVKTVFGTATMSDRICERTDHFPYSTIELGHPFRSNNGIAFGFFDF